jgi:hypothetical protein
MMASVGCSIVGSGIVSTRTSRFPCQVRAFMPWPLPPQRLGEPVGAAAGAQP